MTSIAIVMAVRNGAATLDAALDSIAEQSVVPNELIVIDGLSTDGTQDILARRSRMISHWESAPDKNVSDAWNKALRHVSAQWVWFIGCDDEIADSGVIERWHWQLRDIEPEVGIVYGRVAMVTSSGRIAEVIGAPWHRARRKMHYSMTIPHSGMLSRRALFDKIGPFDTHYALAGDYDWTLRALQHCEARFLDHLTLRMSDSGLSGATRTQVRLATEFGRIAASRGRRPPGWYWLYAKARVKTGIGALFGPTALRHAVDLYRLATFRKPRLAAR